MDTSRRQRVILALLIAVLVVIALGFRHRLGPDFWPPDQSTIGPNLIASVVQYVIIGIGAVLIFPAAKRELQSIKGRHEELHARHAELHVKLDQLAARVEDLHKKV